MIKYCKNCGMPDTRPGIYFNEEDICQGCIYEEEKKTIDWESRWDELEKFVKEHTSSGPYDCVIAVSGGKDSHYQTYLFSKLLGLKCLAVCIHDNMTHTEVGIHNLKNLAEKFNVDLITYKMKPYTQKKIMRYTFEKYNKPFWVVDQMIYTVPIWIAVYMNIPIVVYGENVSVTRGLKDNRDIPEAWNQINNSVVSDITTREVSQECNIPLDELRMLMPAEKWCKEITTPIYTSYFVRWDAHNNYQFAKSMGFKDLNSDPHWYYRWGGTLNYWQIDSYGYLMAFYSKFVNLGHSGFTDCICELIRTGHMKKETGNTLITMFEGTIELNALIDFCKFLDYTEKEVKEIYNKFRGLKQ